MRVVGTGPPGSGRRARERGAPVVEEADDLAELTVCRVARLAVVEPVVDLLSDRGEPEGAEDVVEPPLLRCHLELPGRGVALHDLRPREHSRRVRGLPPHREERRGSSACTQYASAD